MAMTIIRVIIQTIATTMINRKDQGTIITTTIPGTYSNGRKNLSVGIASSGVNTHNTKATNTVTGIRSGTAMSATTMTAIDFGVPAYIKARPTDDFETF